VLATLTAPCPKTYGRVSVELFDAEGSRLPVASLNLGYDIRNTQALQTADAAAFTSQAGHRYLLHVTQSGCTGAEYALEFAPQGALGTRLEPAKACSDANVAATNARVRLKRSRSAAAGCRPRQAPSDEPQLRTTRRHAREDRATGTAARPVDRFREGRTRGIDPGAAPAGRGARQCD
jgi:Fe-S cluster assembly iron-binding protein IscA